MQRLPQHFYLCFHLFFSDQLLPPSFSYATDAPSTGLIVFPCCIGGLYCDWRFSYKHQRSDDLLRGRGKCALVKKEHAFFYQPSHDDAYRDRDIFSPPNYAASVDWYLLWTHRQTKRKFHTQTGRIWCEKKRAVNVCA